MSSDWGVCPYLHAGGLTVPVYSLCMLLALAVGAGMYAYAIRGRPRSGGFAILAAALLGSALGAKLPYLLQNYHAFQAGVRDPEALFSGRTILGGIIGGTLAVQLTKRIRGIRQRNGDFMVAGICVGIAIGRLGCFLRGCCYGQPTTLPWGIDFGDGTQRHPTELYEMLFVLAWLVFRPKTPTETGYRFSCFMLAYFAFRFGNEFLRVEPVFAAGLTAFQWVCLLAIPWFGLRIVRCNYGKSKPPVAGNSGNSPET